jgi:hypothetical protein
MLRVPLALTLCLSLAACGESRLNPLNWFGGEREERITVTEVERPTDPRPLVAEVTGLAIEQTTSGAILTATALTEATGYWQPGLVLIGREDGAATYEFRAAPPERGRGCGPRTHADHRGRHGARPGRPARPAVDHGHCAQQPPHGRTPLIPFIFPKIRRGV